MIFLKRFEKIWGCDIFGSCFEVKLVAERGILHNSNFGSFPGVPLIAFWALNALFALFSGIAFFAFLTGVAFLALPATECPVPLAGRDSHDHPELLVALAPPVDPAFR